LTLLFTVAAPPVSYIRSLHDALPISARDRAREPPRDLRTNDVAHDPTADRVAVANLADRLGRLGGPLDDRRAQLRWRGRGRGRRSEEHTSELQSRENLVCRLLLEKKK